MYEAHDFNSYTQFIQSKYFLRHHNDYIFGKKSHDQQKKTMKNNFSFEHISASCAMCLMFNEQRVICQSNAAIPVAKRNICTVLERHSKVTAEKKEQKKIHQNQCSQSKGEQKYSLLSFSQLVLCENDFFFVLETIQATDTQTHRHCEQKFIILSIDLLNSVAIYTIHTYKRVRTTLFSFTSLFLFCARASSTTDRLHPHIWNASYLWINKQLQPGAKYHY